MPSHRVGGEVDSFCTKCKMMLAHTILAMVGERIARVRCNTCMGEHAYKGASPSEPKPRAASSSSAGARSATRTKAAVLSFDEQLASKDVNHARPYSISEKFTVDQVIEHPTFGRGYVSSARPDKIDVVFKSFVKTLVHARGGGKPMSARPAPMGKPVSEPDEAVEPTPADAAAEAQADVEGHGQA